MKSLGDPLRQIPVFAGATILGDGRVALILDVPGLARHAGITVRGHAAIEALDDAPPPPVVATETVILCRAGGFLAIPQSDIARLEEFPRAMVERLGERRVVQYRGGLLPLVPLSGLLGPRAPGAPGRTSRTSAPTRTARRPARRRSEPSASSWWSARAGPSGSRWRRSSKSWKSRSCPRTPRARASVAPPSSAGTRPASSISRRCWCRRARARRLRAPRRDGRLRRAMAGERMLCTFHVGDLFLGLDVATVQEVLRGQEVTRLPLASAAVRGIINLRGRIVPRWTCAVASISSRRPRGSGRHDRRARSGTMGSLLVDDVGDVMAVSEEAFSRRETMRRARGILMQRVLVGRPAPPGAGLGQVLHAAYA